MSRDMQELASKQVQPGDSPHEQAPYRRMGAPRRVRVKGMEGVDVTVVVTVVRGTVWLSISPPFTWEAFMEPGQVDEVMHALELARDEAKKKMMTAARNGRAAPTGHSTGGSARFSS